MFNLSCDIASTIEGAQACTPVAAKLVHTISVGTAVYYDSAAMSGKSCFKQGHYIATLVLHSCAPKNKSLWDTTVWIKLYYLRT